MIEIDKIHDWSHHHSITISHYILEYCVCVCVCLVMYINTHTRWQLNLILLSHAMVKHGAQEKFQCVYTGHYYHPWPIYRVGERIIQEPVRSMLRFSPINKIHLTQSCCTTKSINSLLLDMLTCQKCLMYQKTGMILRIKEYLTMKRWRNRTLHHTAPY